MTDDPGSTGDEAATGGATSVRRRRLLAGGGALALGAAVPAVGAAGDSELATPRVVWQRRYGGDGDDEADALVRTAGGGYAFAGHTPTDPESPGLGGLWVAALDADGTLVRERTFDDLGGDAGAALAEDPNGELVVAGRERAPSTDAAVVVGVERSGEEAWRARFPPPERYADVGEFAPSAMVRGSDGGYVVAGVLRHNEGAAAWVAKVTADGEAAWSELIEVPIPERFWPVSAANDVAHAADGGYLVGGAAAVGLTYDEFDFRPWAAKLTADGDVEWDRTYLDEYGEVEAVVPRSDGLVLGGGTVEGPIIGPFEYTPVLLWTDARGDVERVRSYPGAPLSVDGVVSSGDGYAYAGETPGGGWGIAKVDRCGTPRWSLVRDAEPIAVRALVGADGGYAVAGAATAGGDADAWVGHLQTDAE